MGLFKILFLGKCLWLCFILFPLPAMAESESLCLDPAAVEKLRSRFEIKIWNSNEHSEQWTAGLDLCTPGTLSYGTVRALLELQSLPPLAQGPSDLDRGALKGTPFDFFANRVNKVYLDANPNSSNCGSGGIVAYVSNSTSKTTYVCPFAAGLTPLALQGNLLHEARHLDDPEYIAGVYTPEHPNETTAYPHALCVRGSFLDYEACDEIYETGGSYAVQVEFLVKVAKTEALSVNTRKEARGMAIITLLEHFNNLPFELVPGVLLLSQEGTLSFYDGDGPLHPLISDIPSTSLVAVRSMPTILDPATGKAESYAGPEIFMKTPGSFSKTFAALPQERRQQVLDVYFGGRKACFLFTDSIYCEINNSKVELPLPAGIEPLHFSIMSMFGGDMVFIVSKVGDLYLVPMNKLPEDWAVEKFEKNKTLTEFISVSLIPGAFNAALKPDGTLVRFANVAEQSPAPGFENIRFKKLMGPFYWAPRLEEL